MADLGIIEPVQRPTNRVNVLVEIEKPNGKTRVMSQAKTFEQRH